MKANNNNIMCEIMDTNQDHNSLSDAGSLRDSAMFFTPELKERCLTPHCVASFGTAAVFSIGLYVFTVGLDMFVDYFFDREGDPVTRYYRPLVSDLLMIPIAGVAWTCFFRSGALANVGQNGTLCSKLLLCGLLVVSYLLNSVIGFAVDCLLLGHQHHNFFGNYLVPKFIGTFAAMCLFGVSMCFGSASFVQKMANDLHHNMTQWLTDIIGAGSSYEADGCSGLITNCCSTMWGNKNENSSLNSPLLRQKSSAALLSAVVKNGANL